VDVRERLAAEVERLRPSVPDVVWVRADNLHLTLKFLGGVDAARLDGVTAALTGTAASHTAFDLTFHGLGAFPCATRPRVLWAGVDEGAAAAAALALGVDAALAALGFPHESRRFSAHVTLGRIREPRSCPRLAGALAAGGRFGRQHVEGISLMRSELSPHGPRYTELAAVPLRVAALAAPDRRPG
jgi:2'-5' RNA ligase